jgi:hypothetical protein
VLEEPVVFGCKERVDHDLRNLVVGDRYAALLTELRDQLAVTAEHLQRQLAAHLAQLGGGRNLGLQVLIGTANPRAMASATPKTIATRTAKNRGNVRRMRNFWDAVLVRLPAACA